MSWEEHAAALGSCQVPREPDGMVPGEGPRPSTWPSQASLSLGPACSPSLQLAGRSIHLWVIELFFSELCSYSKLGDFGAQTPRVQIVILQCSCTTLGKFLNFSQS